MDEQSNQSPIFTSERSSQMAKKPRLEQGDSNTNEDEEQEPPVPTIRKTPKKDPLEVFGQKDALYFIDNYSSDGKCTICQKTIEKNPKQQPHNVRKHYKKHESEFNAYKAWKLIQLGLSENSNGTTLNKKDPSRLLTLYAATSTFPRFHLRNPYLQELFYLLNCPLPSEYQLAKRVKHEMDLVRAQILSLVGSRPFSISVDETTNKAMSLKCLGVIIHFVDSNAMEVRSAALDLVEVTESATGEHLREMTTNTITDFGLDKEKVIRVISDGASNMKKGFFKPFVNNELNDQSDTEDDETYTEFDSTEDEAEFLNQLEGQFNEIETASENFNIWCACHRLQLTAKDFISSSSTFQGLRKRVFQVITKFARSANATQELRRCASKGLLFPATTRWMSIYKTYKRILEIYTHVNAVAISNDWPTISGRDIKKMEELVKLLRPLSDMILAWERDGLSISCVYSGVANLLKYYEKIGHQDGFKKHSQTLISIIERRFNDVINGKDTIYLTTGALDPREAKRVVQHKAVEAFEAIRKIAIELKLSQESSNDSVSTVTEKKSSSILNTFDWMEDDEDETENVVSSNFMHKLNQEWSVYLNEYSLFSDKNPIQFWITHEQKYAILSAVALCSFTVPASSSAVERLFSQVSLNTTSRKANSKITTINQNVFLNYNRPYIK